MSTAPKFESFNWMRGVAGDKRLLAIHRLALIGLGLRNGGPGAVAGELGLDLTTVLGATDAGRRRGWLADHGGQIRFTFPLTATHRRADLSGGQGGAANGTTGSVHR